MCVICPIRLTITEEMNERRCIFTIILKHSRVFLDENECGIKILYVYEHTRDRFTAHTEHNIVCLL